MSTTVQVLFDRPQHEIASLLRDRLTRCISASLVAGFVTVEGLEAISAPLRAHPAKLSHLVVGAGTWRAFDGLDRLVSNGVARGALFVHLGHSRATTSAGAKHAFFRYHPMLHSKVYLMEMGNGTSAAFVGSHNLTGFALLGLNGEAGILLEGNSDEPEFLALRNHISEAVKQAVPYDPTMKDAYSWWTSQFIDGLRAKANDIPDPDDAENKRTVVVIAARGTPPLPQPGEIIYFEIPSALRGSIRSVDTEVHIYIFATIPPSPGHALGQLASANASLWCTTTGLEMDGGGQQLHADWYIDNRRQPDLKRAPNPFQPTPAPGMEQVRVKVVGPVYGKFEYLFERGRVDWIPLFDEEIPVSASADARALLVPLNLVPPEDLPWQRVRGLVAAEPAGSEGYQVALRESSPDSGAFILFSLRRRSKTKSASKAKNARNQKSRP
jgi:HKD family nuclease